MKGRSLPSAKEQEAYLRKGMNEEYFKKVMKKFPGTKWAFLAAYQMIDNKLCGDWQGQSKCPEKEAEQFENYVKDRPESPKVAEALYESAWRRAALIEIYKTELEQKKSAEAKDKVLALTQRIASLPGQSDWSARAATLAYKVQNGIPTYGNASD